MYGDVRIKLFSKCPLSVLYCYIGYFLIKISAGFMFMLYLMTVDV